MQKRSGRDGGRSGRGEEAERGGGKEKKALEPRGRKCASSRLSAARTLAGEQPGEPKMLLRLKPALPQLLLLLGPLGPLSPNALPGPAQAQDAVDLDFFTQQPLHLVSPSFLSITIDANLATDPRFLVFLG
ncbi:hypothetical protein P7K49_006577 [Saguinus oedipus]|uniref:Uncharacterized protein n=1 Tax=Saguinus oedipus TaxID=9490 RepID=A0ABQ9W2T3_SAGOE|nr:hypothetical protein P7K49_006577 [Saguinus oedipus]